MLNNKNNLEEKTLENKLILSNKFFNIFHDKIELPDKKLSSRLYVDHPGGVAIIAITNDNEIILERQYRYPVKETLVELPMGKLEPNEEILDAAKRELQEETGYLSNNWVKIGETIPCNGYSSEIITYFLATDIVSGEQKLDDGEFLEVFKVSIKSAIKMVLNGEIRDSKTVTGLVLYLGYLKKSEIDDIVDYLCK